MAAVEERTVTKSTAAPSTSELPYKPWLDFASTLIWQLIVFVFLIYFRRQIRDLFKRVAEASFGVVKFKLQDSDPGALQLGGKAAEELELRDASGFFTQQGIISVIENSPFAESGEKIRHTLLLFQTAKQRTWLAASSHHLFCVLDDEKNRASGKLLQWILGLKEATPILVRPEDPTGEVDIGPRRRWLYSTRLHYSPDELTKKIENLLKP
jgi:hypothetical protein